MVRDDEEEIAVPEPLHDTPHQGIVVLVELLDGVLVLRVTGAVGRGGGCRMALLEIAPEHVLDAVGGVEDADQGPLAQAVQAPKNCSSRSRSMS